MYVEKAAKKTFVRKIRVFNVDEIDCRSIDWKLFLRIEILNLFNSQKNEILGKSNK